MFNLSEIEQERFDLAFARLREIAACRDDSLKLNKTAEQFFVHEAAFLVEMERLRQDLAAGMYKDASLADLQAQNRELYEEILPENYAECYGNPSFAAEQFGENGQAMSFLYMELRGAIVYAYENRPWDLLILMELLLVFYSSYVTACEEAEEVAAGNEGIAGAGNAGSAGGENSTRTANPAELNPEPEALRREIYWYAYDYCPEFMHHRVQETLDPAQNFAADIILQEDLSDPRYLYRFGEYITENEIRTAAFLAKMSEEEIESIARTWTEGYRIGFIVGHKDITIKDTVNIRWRLGFERVVRAAVRQFEEMGLKSVLYRSAAHVVNKHAHIRIGWYGAVPNQQFEYDHRNDSALYVDERFVSHRLQALQQAYEEEKELAAVHGGPAVMDTFGEKLFTPENNSAALHLTAEQQQLAARYQTEAGQITNRYIKGEERSFTIIAYPVPDIGARFEEIFQETVRINNLDYKLYQRIQQNLIDALDEGVKVHITGRDGNETDLTIALHALQDPAKQTIFENCVADVNIPVGEVFTSPQLTGTNGLLHVKQVFLEGLQYHDLKIRLTDGMISEYSCTNFADKAENRQLIEENILFHHPTVPIGEFAIGTNTTAYQVAHTYGIADKFPILIAEKMGPHFAMGDTCYSFQEDVAVYNPDGKEIIARDNERSLLRKTDPEKAYFGCHTDITIPYEELGAIRVIRADGSEITLLENGRFVLPGTEVLNEPLDEL
ncbi:MAG: aminopeptidase [Eubacterium sp.]|nr:aminopeptidase [Eubacterium sp.]